MASTAVVLESPRHSDQEWRQEEDVGKAGNTTPAAAPHASAIVLVFPRHRDKKGWQKEDAGTAGSRPRAVALHSQL